MNQETINEMFDLNEKNEANRKAIYTAAKIFAETLHRHAIDGSNLNELIGDIHRIAHKACKY